MTARWIQTGSSTIEVMNKADLMGGVGPVATRLRSVAIAAQTSEGLPELLAAIESRLSEGMVTVGYDTPAAMAPNWLGFTRMVRSLGVMMGTKPSMSPCACCRRTTPGLSSRHLPETIEGASEEDLLLEKPATLLWSQDVVMLSRLARRAASRNWSSLAAPWGDLVLCDLLLRYAFVHHRQIMRTTTGVARPSSAWWDGC
jgi:hypothetical protein